MTVEVVLMVLSGLVVCSYVFDLIAKNFKIPSVILLLLSGIGLNYLANFLSIPKIKFRADSAAYWYGWINLDRTGGFTRIKTSS
jgi:hypothetical protein